MQEPEGVLYANTLIASSVPSIMNTLLARAVCSKCFILVADLAKQRCWILHVLVSCFVWNGVLISPSAAWANRPLNIARPKLCIISFVEY